MRRSTQFLVPLVALAVAGCSGRASPESAGVVPELLTVRPAGDRGPLVAFEPGTLRRRFELPRGLASADGARYVARTRRGLAVYETRTGRVLAARRLAPGWQLGAVSAAGRWLVLARRTEAGTRVRVLDSAEWTVAGDLRLRGRYEVDTISPDGSALFLIQYLTSAKAAYVIWLYDLRTRRFSQPGDAEPKGREEVMAGYAWGGVASPDGRWLLTLFLNTRRNVAFVHALNLETRTPRCIDLPSAGGRFDLLEAYSLAVTPGGHMLLAANPALGVVAEVDLATGKVARTAALGRSRGVPRGVRTETVVSPDGRMLYVARGAALWRYDSRTGVARGPARTGGDVADIAVSRDGRRLFVLRGDGRPVSVDAAGGAVL